MMFVINKENMSRKSLSFFSPKNLLALILALFIVQSCASAHARGTGVEPTLTLDSLDAVICPQTTPVSYPAIKKPKLIYILIDRSGSYGRYTKRAMDVLIEGLELSVEPGDRLFLVWLGSHEDPNHSSLPHNPSLPDKYLLVETVPQLAVPVLLSPLPTFNPTSTPEPTLISTITPISKETLGVLEAQSVAQTLEALNKQLTVTVDASNVIATNMAIQVENGVNKLNCDQALTNDQNLKLIKDWEKQKRQMVDAFIDRTFEPLKDLNPQANDPNTHLYNSLYFAARAIRDEKNTDSFGSYYLIVLSDMEDAGSREGEKLEVDLTGVNVLMSMVYCSPSIDCQNKESYWRQYFIDHGAILPTYPFRLVDETTPYVISNFFQMTGGIK